MQSKTSGSPISQKKIAVLSLALNLALTTSSFAATEKSWDFRVFLDDKPIGNHRFVLRAEDSLQTLTSKANFVVKFWMFNAYEYKHQAEEVWRNDCLIKLESKTKDGAKNHRVSAVRDGDKVKIASDNQTKSLPGCIMSFAYWNPKILEQSYLLNSQTGKYEKISWSQLGPESITIQNQPVIAQRYQLKSQALRIDLWYSPTQEWLGLESATKQGRKLRYQLQ
jgi:hypothetical protein